MRIFLGVLMVLIVSGDEEIVIEGIIGMSVLLPCNCSERNVDMIFKWQKEDPNTMLVFLHNKSTSDFYDRYKDRSKIFLAENSSNCSFLITNITADDQGKYKCVFKRNGQYIKSFVHLNVSASYNVCVTKDRKDNSENVFKCDVNGRYRDSEIQWYLNEELLTNSSTTTITHDYALDTSNGTYRFNSKLVTEISGDSEPTCEVKAKQLSTIIYSCDGKHDPQSRSEEPNPESLMRNRYLKIIPIMMVLGFSLVLWRRQK